MQILGGKMEKVVNIGGRDVTLKVTAKLPIVFEAQFNKNFMQVQNDLLKIARTDEKGNQIIDLTKLDYLSLCQIIWAMEKSANPETPPFDDWLDLLDALPMIDTVAEITDLLLANLTTKSKIKNANAAAN